MCIICTGSHSGFVQFVIHLLAVLSVLLFVHLKSERYDIFVLQKAIFRQTYAVLSVCYSFLGNSYGPWTLTKCDSMLSKAFWRFSVTLLFVILLIYLCHIMIHIAREQEVWGLIQIPISEIVYLLLQVAIWLKYHYSDVILKTSNQFDFYYCVHYKILMYMYFLIQSAVFLIRIEIMSPWLHNSGPWPWLSEFVNVLQLY